MEALNGVWRTVGGRRIFIKDGQDLATAMKESRKFSKSTKFIELDNNSKELTTAQSQSDNVFKSMKEQDKLMIDDYTAGGYEQLNNYLRGNYVPSDNKMKEYLEKQNDSISYSISQYKLETDLKLYRGQGADIYSSLKVGDTLIEKGFTSTSCSKSVALDFSKHYNNDKEYLIEINVPKTSKCLYIGRNGSFKYDEGEFLLDKNTKFKVIQKESNKIVLEVKND